MMIEAFNHFRNNNSLAKALEGRAAGVLQCQLCPVRSSLPAELITANAIPVNSRDYRTTATDLTDALLKTSENIRSKNIQVHMGSQKWKEPCRS